MLCLQEHHIIDLYCFVDDIVKNIPKTKGGRPNLLKNSEIITILIWNVLTVQQKNIKQIHKWLKLYHYKDFPKIPKYSAFVEHCHRMIPIIINLLEQILCFQEPLRIVDSTMLEVCKLVRANSHKVTKGLAQFGKNHQGWHFGFKLHASIDLKGRFCGLAFTGANVYDAQVLPKILNNHTKIVVGDGTYGASVMRKFLWETLGTIIITPPHPKQNKKILVGWQGLLLKIRPKIESFFDYLKEHLMLVSSFPRSFKGFLFHYLRIILGYQILAIF